MSRLAKHLLTKLSPKSGQPNGKPSLKVESLEDRSVPSTNIPLSGLLATPLGPAPLSGSGANNQTGGLTTAGRVVSIGVHPTDSNITFIGTAGGGVALSKNAVGATDSVTWSHLTDNLTDAQVLNDTTNRNNFMGAVAVNPNNSNWVYAGQGDPTLTNFSYSGRGLLTSKDAGVTWQLQQGPGGAFNRATFEKFVFHPTNANIMFAIVNRSTLLTFEAGRYGVEGQNAVWRSLDGGDTWQDITNNLSTAIPNFPITRFAKLTDFTLDRNNPNIGYVAIGDPAGYNLNGVYRTDGVLEPVVANINWTVAFGGNGTFVPGSQLGNTRVQAAPSSASTIYALIDRLGGPPGEDPLFVRSTDSGVNWTQLTAISKDVPGFNVNYYNLQLLVDPLDPNRVFAAGTGTTPVVFSRDGGLSWESLSKDNAGEGPYPYIHSMVLAPDRSLIVGTDGGVFRMTINQTTFSTASVDWTSLNGKNTQSGLTQPPGVNGASQPGALNNQSVLGVALPPGTAGEQYQDDALLYGTYLHGSGKFFDPGTQIQNPSAAYGALFSGSATASDTTAYQVYDFLNSNRAYQVSTVSVLTNNFSATPAPMPLNFIYNPGNSSVSRTDDGGKTWTAINNGITNPNEVFDEFTNALQIDPSNRLRLLYGTDVVNVTTDGGNNWGRGGIPDLPFVTNQQLRFAVISQLAVGRFTGNVIYAAVMGRQIPGTNPPADAGPAIYRIDLRITAPAPEPAWRDVSPGRFGPAIMPPIPNAPPNPVPNVLTGQVTDLLVDPVDSNVLYATVDTPQTSGRIWRTINGGLSDWVDITGNLPVGSTPGTTALRPYTITLDPRELGNSLDDEVYVGTEVGVYKLVNPTGAGPFNWVRITDGSGRPLPDVMVRDLAINTTTGVLAIGTMGRGAWEIQVRPYLRGFVFEDKNGNGVQDSAIVGPPPVAAETNFTAITPKVQAFDISNPANIFESANTLTTVNGFYVFRSLKDSTYEFKVQDASYPVVDPVATYQITTPPRTQSLTQTSYVNNVDIGLFRRISIGGVAFNDLNANKIQDAGEPGLADWVMELRRSDNNALLATVTTNATGVYTFTGVGVIPGVPFRVTEVVQPGWQVLSPTGGFFDLPAVLASGDNSYANAIPFANFKLGSIAGTAFEDSNGNGLLNGSEAGLAGRVIQLINPANNSLLATTTTDALGAYTFTGLTFGTYRIRQVLPTGWINTTTGPADFPTVSGTVLAGIDLGSMRPGSITGTVWEDLNGDGIRQLSETTVVPNATISLIDPRTNTTVATTTTNFTGVYTFSNLFPLLVPGGNTVPYSVLATAPATYAQTSTPPAVTLASNTASTGRDIGLFLRTSISGFAFEDVNGNGVQDPGEPPLQGGQIGLLNSKNNATVATTTTDANGNFTFSGLGPLQVPSPGGTVIPYTVGGTGTGTILTTPTPPPITLSSGIPVGGIIVGLFRQVLFTGIVFNDVNGNGSRDSVDTALAGRTVQLVNSSSGVVVANTTTDANGNYTLAAGPGTYTVRMVSPTGWVQTNPNPGNFSLTSGQTVPSSNFGSFRLVSIGGSLFHDTNGNGTRQSTEPPVVGFGMQLINAGGTVVAVATSAADGSFTFSNVGPGTYRVLELPPSPWRVTTTNPVTLATESGNNVTLSYPNYLPMTVSGRVYEDLNRNGIDDTEPGLAGWTVELFSSTLNAVVATTQTTATGAYSFTGVAPPGPLQARLVLQSGFIRTNGNPVAQAFSSGSPINFGGMGVLRLGSMAGRVYLDGNRNSINDSFEGGLAGAVIGLFDGTGVEITRTTSDASGNYIFLNLQPGTYTVRLLTAPGGFTLSGAGSLGSFTRTVTPGSTSANNAITSLNFGVIGRKRYAVAADGGGGPRVQIYDATTGDLLKDFFVFEVSFSGGVRVTSADINGDGVDDLVVAAGKGGGPRVRVIDGATDRELYNFFVYESSFRDGMYVAAGDVNGDSFDDIITGTDAGGGPRVTVYSGKDGSQIADYFAYDSSLRGGVRIGTGDINGDGISEVLTVPGQGAQAEVIAWNTSPLSVMSRFMAFDSSYTGGAYVAGGTAGVDGRSLVIVGSGTGYPGAPVIRTFEGLTGTQRIETQAFFPFIDGSEFSGEVRVSSFDRNGDAVPDLVLATGAGSPSRIRFLDGRNLRQIGGEINPFETAFIGGVFIG